MTSWQVLKNRGVNRRAAARLHKIGHLEDLKGLNWWSKRSAGNSQWEKRPFLRHLGKILKLVILLDGAFVKQKIFGIFSDEF